MTVDRACVIVFSVSVVIWAVGCAFYPLAILIGGVTAISSCMVGLAAAAIQGKL